MMEFHEWFFEQFIKWEKKQPKKRSSYSAFAKYLTEKNRHSIAFSPQLVSAWINNEFKPGDKFIVAIADVLGKEIYGILNMTEPDPLLRELSIYWGKLSDEEKNRIHAILETASQRYTTETDHSKEPNPTPASP